MQARAVGQQWGWLGRTSVTTSETKLRGHAEWGDCPESMQKAERRPGETAAVRDRGGAGDPARRLGWRPTVKGRSGPPRQPEDTSQSCGPGVVEQLGVLEIHLRQDRSEG